MGQTEIIFFFICETSFALGKTASARLYRIFWFKIFKFHSLRSGKILPGVAALTDA
jgi:hypothetical protein